ncbi:MAG: DUF1080 domain-containing protein [Anaerolineales bacterium]|nr:DUF1080 domain-containing protein [Anaerolineales bacterium]
MLVKKLLPISIFLLVLTSCSIASGNKLPSGVLYQDDFSADNGTWLLESDMEATASIHDGRLYIDIDSPNLIAWAELKEQTFKDFELELDAIQVGGPDNNSYGIIFRMKDPSAYYRFDISGDGYYALTRRDALDGGSWVWITDDWMESDAINRGASANHIKIIAQDDQFEFWVNGVKISTLQDGAYSSGSIGLDAGTFHESGVQVAFDNLVIREP